MSKLTKHEIQHLIKECRKKQGYYRQDIVEGSHLSNVDIYNLEVKLTDMLIEIGELC
jgi:hypothetical protein